MEHRIMWIQNHSVRKVDVYNFQTGLVYEYTQCLCLWPLVVINFVGAFFTYSSSFHENVERKVSIVYKKSTFPINMS